MPTSALPEFWVSKSRLETLLDGVFAIAMTLMVLEIKIPALADPKSLPAFAAAMRQNLPALFAYLFSMAVLGLFWYRHHRQYHFIVRITPGLLAVNLAFLTVVCFFPFAAGVFGRYPTNFGVYFVYLPPPLIMTALLTAQWALARRGGLLAPDLAPEAIRAVQRENLLALVLTGILTVTYLGTIVAIQVFGLGRETVGFAALVALPAVLVVRLLRQRADAA